MKEQKRCLFCTPIQVVLEDALVYARLDTYPVNPGHVLIIPRRHVSDYFDTSREEKSALIAMIDRARNWLQDEYAPDGFNVGVNCGLVAGQSVMHAHIHVIPRYEGDMPDPRGGVRGVIPEKQKYVKSKSVTVP